MSHAHDHPSAHHQKAEAQRCGVSNACRRQPTKPLANRHHVGERLARMGRVGEPVDHRNRGVRGQLLDIALRVGADHEAVEVAGKNGRGVAKGLAAAELQVAGGEVEADAAELCDPDLERDARAG